MSFLSELKRRNVYRVGALYVVVGWLLLQVTDVITSVLDLPVWTGKLVAVLLFLGLPIVLIGAWAFELTPDGLIRDRAAKDERKRTGKRHVTDYVILALLLTALSWMAWQHDWGEERPQAEESDAIRSLVVLPFKNLMNDDSQGYFVEGMHDALITELSRISALRVISRTSANRYRDADLPLPAIAEELGVEALVEGSVLRSENTVRINVQLIDAKADRHIWGEQFDRNLGDILSLYSDVTRRITEQIQVQVSDSEQAHLAEAEAVNSQTYDQFLRSVDLCNRWAPQPMLLGIEQLRDLIEKEPDNGRAHAALALCLQYAAFFDFVVNTEIRDEALNSANRAVTLTPDLTMALVAKGGTYWYLDFDAKTAIQALERALEINPSDLRALIHYSWLMSESGLFGQAIESAKRAIRTDPFNNAAQQALGQAYYLARDFQSSLQPLMESVNLDPSDPSFYVYAAWSNSQLNRHEEALSLLETAIDLSGGAPFHLAEYGMALAFAGKTVEAEAVLAQLESMHTVSPFHIAQINMALGNLEAAMDGFEAAYNARDNGLFYIAHGAQFDSLRDNQRFQALVKKMKP